MMSETIAFNPAGYGLKKQKNRGQATIYDAGQQGGLVGGGNQVLLPKNLRVDPGWIRE